MKTLLFKTYKLAKSYIEENYPSCDTEFVEVDLSCVDEYVDMQNFIVSGDTGGYNIIDDDFNIVERVCWWEDGDETYVVKRGDVAETFDNIYDARARYEEIVDAGLKYGEKPLWVTTSWDDDEKELLDMCYESAADHFRKAVGEQLCAARQAKGLTLRDLAAKCGLAFNHIGRIEQGRYNLTVDTLSKVCEALDLDIKLV